VRLNGGVAGGLPGNAPLDAYGAAGPLLPTLFASSVVGVAVVDSRMRFRAINGTLAAMNGVSVARHLGRKLRYVLGGAAAKVEEAMEQVLQSGEPVSNLELRAQLPSRPEVGHWVLSYFPVRDLEGRVTQVVGVVLEITEKKNLGRSLSRMIGNLLHVGAALKTELQYRGMTGGCVDEQTGLLARAIELVEHCIAEAQNIAAVTRPYHSVSVPQMQLVGGTHWTAPAGNSIDGMEKRGRDGGGWARRLSQRERKVLQLLAECKSNKEVAAALGISVRTAETYRARIMLKLNLHSLGHLVLYAVRNRIIEV